jgi:hypothetical protein
LCFVIVFVKLSSFLPRRNPFTNEDDQHLVEYLATYSPGIAGRCGNNLYKNLVENVSGADMYILAPFYGLI